jgi:hypothetical protein
MPRQPKNLLLDTEAIRRGQRYCELHGTTLSQLVSDFLASLPVDEDGRQRELTPAVRRLLGVAAGADAEEYRRYLEKKYGR